MLEFVRALPAETLELKHYSDDFQEHFWGVDVSWKLERQESFREPDVPSWVAMERGDWDTAVRLIEEMRAPRTQLQKRLDEKGIVQRRVRIVSDPVTPYLQWELRALRLWAELGEQVRVLPTEAVRGMETTRKLPEVVVLGGEDTEKPIMYEIAYREGVLDGARKFVDPYLIGACRAEIADLWHRGEDLVDYYDRVVASLPPPYLVSGMKGV